MPWAAAAAIVGIVSGGLAAREQRKARKQAMERMRQDQDNFDKSLASQVEANDKKLKAAEKVHKDNMDKWKKEFEANQKAMNYQLAQADTGLQLQAQAMHNAQMESNRQLANQKASIERQINQQSENRQQAHYQKKDEGIAGTLLTGPGGVKEDDLKKQKKTLLGR